MRTAEVLQAQRAFFASGETIPVRFRIENLKKLYAEIKRRENEITAALTQDLGKSGFEGFMCEVGLVLSEISYMIKHVRAFSARRRAKTPITQFAASSFTQAIPYGNVLIMSPWNYPFLLTMGPLANAIAAGNTAVVKPSAYSPATSTVIAEILRACFSQEYIAPVLGGRAENAELLKQKFDFVFFTGSASVGREVLRHTAEHLTPAVLELGGKSPCIVDASAKLKLAAKRIVFGKYLNCGQTCVAPDYVLCEKSVKEELVREIKKQIAAQYGETPLSNPNYGKIINEKHFTRLCGLIDSDKVVHGGEADAATHKIAPTVLDNVTWSDPVMQEEIFGPVLPILTFERWEEIAPCLAEKETPLALYLFSENRAHQREAVTRFAYGGGCINDVVVHLATSEMGFGGMGESGMGAYHGKRGFDTFSHQKSILDKKTWMDLPMRYQPYRKCYGMLLKLFLR